MKLCVFDIDGTLTNTLNSDDLAFRFVLRNLHNINLSDELWETYKIKTTGTDSGLIFSIYKDFYNTELTNELYLNFRNEFVELLKNDIKLSPQNFTEIYGTKQLFEFLNKQKQLAYSIATGSWYESAVAKLKAININTDNLIISGADKFQVRAEIIQNSINLAKIKFNQENFSEIIYVGDGVWDFVSSKLLNIKFIGIDSNQNNKLKNEGAGEIYPNIYELLNNCDVFKLE